MVDISYIKCEGLGRWSVVKNPGCSCRGPGFLFQHLPFVIQVPGNPKPFYGLCRLHAHKWYPDTHSGKTLIPIKQHQIIKMRAGEEMFKNV